MSEYPDLTPLTAPTTIPRTAITVGTGHTTPINTMLSRLETSLHSPGEQAALVVTTSGSTGTPKQTVLSSRALTASGHATEQFAGARHAQWMLALPTHYVAGAQVLARSVLAGTTPVITESISHGTSFTTADFLATAESMTASDRMLSLVPTQLVKLLEASEQIPEIIGALQSFNAILLGGAPASASLLATARSLNIRVLTTYGSAETAGGCVYNGTPLPGVQIRIQDDDTQPNNDPHLGRVWLGGPTIASGYLNNQAKTSKHFFVDETGQFWYRTDDLGHVSDTLEIAGRADDVIITGGVKVSPAPVAAKLEEHGAVREAFVCGIEDSHWGMAVVAAINMVPGSKPESLKQELSQLAQELDAAQRPKKIIILDDFPVLSTGKPDRNRLKQLLSSHTEASTPAKPL